MPRIKDSAIIKLAIHKAHQRKNSGRGVGYTCWIIDDAAWDMAGGHASASLFRDYREFAEHPPFWDKGPYAEYDLPRIYHLMAFRQWLIRRGR